MTASGVVDDVACAGAWVELVGSGWFGIVARSVAFGDSEAIAKPIRALARRVKRKEVPIANRYFLQIVSAERFQYKGATAEQANLRGARTGALRPQGVEVALSHKANQKPGEEFRT